jgi:mannose/fructose/N-acetylgalactosamine-specific phosphotransferase system component IIB
MLVTSIPQYIQGVTNAKVDLTTTDVTVLYTAPSETDFNSSIVNSILVSNDSGSADTITVTITDSASAVFSLFKVKAVAANTTIELLTRDLILQSGEIITVTAATADRLHVVASVQELTKTRISTSAIL